MRWGNLEPNYSRFYTDYTVTVEPNTGQLLIRAEINDDSIVWGYNETSPDGKYGTAEYHYVGGYVETDDLDYIEPESLDRLIIIYMNSVDEQGNPVDYVDVKFGLYKNGTVTEYKIRVMWEN